MSDRPINRDPASVRDNDGNVYDVEGDHAEAAPGDPRDESAGYPTSGFVAGGAGGTGGMGAVSASGTSSAAPGSTSDLRATSESGMHGTVAESADLGQRPLEDYKREGDAALDSTGTTVRAGARTGDPADARPAGSYTSDDDAVASSSMTTDPARGTGTIVASTDNSSGATSGDRVRTESGREDVGSGGGGISSVTDNTGPIGSAVPATLTGVAAGYRVVDVNGDDIGKVRDVRSGDLGAATTGGGDDGYDEGIDQSIDSTVDVAAVPTGIGTSSGGSGAGIGVPAVVATDNVDDASDIYGDGEPNVDEPAFTRLSRVGFIKIDSKGWFASDRYAGADQVDRVAGETVYLSVGKDELLTER